MQELAVAAAAAATLEEAHPQGPSAIAVAK
jgi:hypothetical protein